MASRTVNPNVNDNTINLSKFRGPVRPCPMCRPGDELLRGMQSCRLCLGNRFVAKCLNCDGTGMYSGRSPWDGGRSEQSSTCDKCGGQGVFPAKRPADWPDEEVASAAAVPSSVPVAETEDVNRATLKAVLPPPPSMQSGTVLPGGVVVK